MNFKSYIDAIKYKKMGNESCFIIGGWCFSVSGEKVEYQVLINGKAVKFDIQRIARRDVTQKMAKYQPELSCGFSMTIPVNPEVEAPKALELYAVSGNEKKKIVSLNEAKIEKITDTRSISYHLEYVRPEEKGDAVKYSIGGWAISEKKARDMEYQILDASGQDVDKTVRMVNRDDLYKLGMVDKEKKYCGFIVEFLGDQFEGYFTCDGYQAYHSLPGRIAVTGYMAHARRRFDEALTVLKKDFTKEELKETTAYQAMARIGMLYKIEEMIRDKSPKERYEERQKQAKPLLEAFFEWLHRLEDSVDRSSMIGEAVLYALNQEVYLKRYLEDGHLSIDNLAAERALKNFATGRRNWLFAKSIRGAQASATVYSITETAMLNGQKPYNYLTYVMEKMKDLGPFPEKGAMLELLPWSSSLTAN